MDLLRTGLVTVLAQAGGEDVVGMATIVQHLVAALVFSVLGVLVFALCLFMTEKLTPFSLVKEIGEDNNVAVAIVVAAIVLGMSIIIGASILG